jgi:hypothetical protein
MLNGVGLNSPFLMSPKPLPPGDASTSCAASAASASIIASVMRTIVDASFFLLYACFAGLLRCCLSSSCTATASLPVSSPPTNGALVARQAYS